MKILHLSSEPSSIAGLSGGSTRQFFLLKQLVARGAEVKTVSPCIASRLETSDAERACRDAGIDFVAVMRDDNRLREAVKAARKDPRVVSDFFSAPLWGWRGSVFWPSMEKRVEELLTGWRPDVILIESDHLAHWASRLRTQIPMVLMAQNASWDVYAKRANSASSAIHRARMQFEEKRFRRHVRKNPYQVGRCEIH